jgi:HEAT repeat protein
MITLMNEISEEHVDYNFKPVLRWALADADADVRQRAIDGLTEEDSPRIIAPLLHILTNDPHPATRSSAALALARFCEYAALEELPESHVAPLIDGLTAALATNGDYPEVYRRIIEALGWGADANIDALIEDTWHHSDIRMRESALVAMGRSMSERWYPTVKQALDNGHPAIRYEAARAAGLYGDDALTCIPQLINLAQEDDIEVATAAIWALGQINDHRAIKALEQFSTSRDQAKREAALDVLGSEGGTDDLLGNWRNAFRSTDDDDDDDEE